MSDEAFKAQFFTELTSKTEPMELVLQPSTVFQLTALVQLACRHPGVGTDTRAAAARFLEAVRTYFADCPTALELVRRGDDPEYDQ